MNVRIYAAGVALAISSTAAAQPAANAPAAAPPPAQQRGEPVNETTAALLSIGGTTGSWLVILGATRLDDQSPRGRELLGLGLIGALAGPSFGHWYAHSTFTRGLGLRLAGAAAEALTLVLVAKICEDDCTLPPFVTGLSLAGAGLYLWGTVDDMVTAPRAARRYNERLHDVALAPLAHPGGGGLAIVGRF